MAWHGELFAMPIKAVLKVETRMIDSVIGVQFYLPHSPIPDSLKVPEPILQLSFLFSVEPEFKLILYHFTHSIP
jgi:hypothetical protein